MQNEQFCKVSDIRNNVGECMDEVRINGKRLVVHRYHKPVAAIVPMRDLERLRAMDQPAPPPALSRLDPGF